jgi:hypothetical protein
MRLLPGSIDGYNRALESLQTTAAAFQELATANSLAAEADAVDQATANARAKLFIDLSTANNTLAETLATPNLFGSLDASVFNVLSLAATARTTTECFVLTGAISDVRFAVDNVSFETDTLSFFTDEVIVQRDSVNSLAAKMANYESSEDVSFAIFSAEDLARQADTLIADINDRSAKAMSKASAEFAKVENLDKDC